ncbi:hypothetical protein [Salinisphaera sp.]|uniref:hypothetical protein n=1 Tax=Salinisphaera sp. TaxID=1914330 RepID=UPI003C7D5300
MKQRIEAFEEQLESAKEAVREWTDANADLSRSAAEARAKNQGAGTGVMAGLLGSKYRGAVRRAASASNASIARDVAKKRALIAENKRAAQEHVRDIKSKIAETKKELKELIAYNNSVTRRQDKSKKQKAGSIDLLYKLKEAHELGLLTDEEYEAKRKSLASQI